MIHFHLSCFPDPLSESQALEGKVGGPNWPGGLDRRVGLFAGQHSRPRAFSQSAVHTLEQRERERDMEKVRGYYSVAQRQKTDTGDFKM